MKKNSSVFVLIVILVLIGAGGFYFFKKTSGGNTLIDFRDVSLPDTAATTTDTPTDVPKAISESTPPTTAVTADMRGYQNPTFHFGLLFPKNLVAHQYLEAGGALTVTFNDDSTGESFQIYVTPYAGKQITDARFKLDEPSGVYQEPTDISVDNTRATMFFSTNAIMGDTREVWFIHPEPGRGVQSYLYEVTTYKELDTWLASIIQTWKFL